MNLIKSLRELFGLAPSAEPTISDRLQELRLERDIATGDLQKAREEFNEVDLELYLKQQAAELLLQKGGDDAVFNLKAISDRRDRLATEFLNESLEKGTKVTELNVEVSELEVEILSKAIEVTTSLSPEQQAHVRAELVAWKYTGLLDGEPVEHEVDAIQRVLGSLVKGGEGSKGGRVIGHTSSGKPVYDTFKHEEHKEFTAKEHDEAKEINRYKGRFGAVNGKYHKNSMSHQTAAVNQRRDATQKEKEAKPGYAEKNARLKELHTKMEAVPKLHSGLVAHTHQKEWDKLHKEYNEIHAEINKSDDDQPLTKSQVESLVKASPDQKKKVKKVMDEWKSGKLKSSSGDKVGDQKQAIAIALSEAGLSKSEAESVELELEKAGGQASTSPIASNGVRYDSPVEGHYANALITRTERVDGKDVERTLFLQRGPSQVEAGKWCLPGGHIEVNETIEAAASRELKEEAHLDAFCYVVGKAKCANGKWAFYCSGYVDPTTVGQLALLDGESRNACWMTRQEWMTADLFYDLKKHLVALTTSERNLSDVRDIMKPLKKADENDMLYPLLDEEDSKKKS